MLIKCPECKNEVSTNAKTCPQCGENLEDGLKNSLEKLGGTFVGVLLTILIAIGVGGFFEEMNLINDNNLVLVYIIAFSTSILIIGNVMSKIVKKFGRKFVTADGGVHDYSQDKSINKMNKIAFPIIAIMIVVAIGIKVSEPVKETHSTVGIGTAFKDHKLEIPRNAN
jgi:hypothetical protein